MMALEALAVIATATVAKPRYTSVHPHAHVTHRPARSATQPRGARAVALARRYLGVPYVWGGASPSGFDCSGLIQYVYRRVGVIIPRTTYDQINAGRWVSLRSLLPGDLVFSNGGTHVGLYAGHGLLVVAPHSGANVRIEPLAYFGAEEARRVT